MQRNHSITILLPIFVFVLFVSLSVSVVLFSSRIYERNVASATENFDASTAVSYVVEKIHASDTAGSVSVGTFHGTDALIFTREIGDAHYHTYIYAYDDYLCELLAREGDDIPASAGTKIIRADSFQPAFDGPHRLTFSLTDERGRTISAEASVFSGGDR